MNQTQTRPWIAASAVALSGALLACNAPERDAPPRHSPSAPVPTGTLASAPSASAARAPLASERAAPAASASTPPTPALSADPAASVKATPHFVVAAVGDSLTDPRSHGGGYLEYLESRCPNLEVDNFGKGGAMLNQMRRRFSAEVEPSTKRYTHLLIFGGVNDLYSDLTARRTPEKMERDLSYLYAWGHQHGLTVVAFTVAPWGGFKRYFNDARGAATRELNAWIRQQAATGTVDLVVDAYRLLSCGDPDQLCPRFFEPFKDGLHFGPDAHRLLGEALFQAAFSDCG